MGGDEAAWELSGRIIRGLQRHVTVLALNVDERDLLLSVLEDVDRPELAELRAVLCADLGHRYGID